MANKRTILLVGESFFPDNTPRANRWHYFSSELKKRGWQIQVISRHFNNAKLDDIFNSPTVLMRNPSFFCRVFRKVFSELIFEHQILWAIRRLVLFIRTASNYKDVDLVVAYGLPFSGVVLGGVIARFLGKPLVVEYGDPWDINPARNPTALERHANKWIMNTAARVIVTNENYAEFARKFYCRQIECLLPVTSLNQSAKGGENLRDHLSGIGQGFKAFYAGMFYDGIRSGVPFLEAIEDINENIVFIHAGYKYNKALYCSRYNNIGYISQIDVLNYLYWADVVLYFSNESIYQTPSKITEISFIAPTIIAIGNSFSEFEREQLSRAQTIYAKNNKSEIINSLVQFMNLKKSELRSTANFQSRIACLAEYNSSIVSKLDVLFKGCITAQCIKR